MKTTATSTSNGEYGTPLGAGSWGSDGSTARVFFAYERRQAALADPQLCVFESAMTRRPAWRRPHSSPGEGREFRRADTSEREEDDHCAPSSWPAARVAVADLRQEHRGLGLGAAELLWRPGTRSVHGFVALVPCFGPHSDFVASRLDRPVSAASIRLRTSSASRRRPTPPRGSDRGREGLPPEPPSRTLVADTRFPADPMALPVHAWSSSQRVGPQIAAWWPSRRDAGHNGELL